MLGGNHLWAGHNDPAPPQKDGNPLSPDQQGEEGALTKVQAAAFPNLMLAVGT